MRSTYYPGVCTKSDTYYPSLTVYMCALLEGVLEWGTLASDCLCMLAVAT